VPDDETNMGTAGRFGDHSAFIEGQSKRLFDQQVLAVLRCKNGMARVKLMRRRNINRLDTWIRAQFLDRFIRFGLEISGKPRPRFRPRIRRGNQGDPRIARQSRQHHGEGAPKARHSQTHLALRIHDPLRLDKDTDIQ
jgi:hypothetical protein